MTAEQHGRIRALFAEALEMPEADRLAFLQSTCSGETEVLSTVLRLLEAHRGCQSFLQEGTRPALRIGRYLVTGEIGRGAMGIVYEAIDPLINRKVALKVVRLEAFADAAEAGLLRERLFREARSAGVLSHPGIVGIFDVGQEGDLAFIAMELVEGESLYQVFSSGRPIPHVEAFDILRQVANALDYAHRSGVVHRDIKPANIMLDRTGRVRIADFGIAKITSADIGTATLTGAVVGTPSYMSPEQIDAQGLDGRSDQFSLAVLAYEMLTGCKPFLGPSLASLAHAIVYSERPSARAVNPQLAPGVDGVLCRSLARAPGQRYASCSEFVSKLEETLEGGVTTPLLDVPAWTRRFGEPEFQVAEDVDAAPLTGRRWQAGSRSLIWAGLATLAVVAGFVFYRVVAPESRQVETKFAVKQPAPASVQSGTRGKRPKLRNPGPERGKDVASKVVAPSSSGTTDASHVVSSGGVDSEPILLTKVPQVYPEIAQKLRARGTVQVQLVVQPDGTAANVTVEKALGYGLDESAVEAVKKWQFQPAMKDGKAVPRLAHADVAMYLVGRGSDTWYSGETAFVRQPGITLPVVGDGTMPKPGGENSNESVILEFTVDASGSVKSIYIRHGTKSAAALLSSSLVTWKFRPAMKGDRTVEATGRVLFVKGQGDEAVRSPLWPQRSVPVQGGVTLTPLDPATVDKTARSINGKVPAIIQFVNQSRRAVDIYWIDPNGNRVLYQAGLATGGRWSETTYLTHPWLVVLSGTGGTTARGTGTLLAGFEAVTPNPTLDPAKRDIAIITDREDRR
jgi:TonB family protein